MINHALLGLVDADRRTFCQPLSIFGVDLNPDDSRIYARWFYQ